MKHTPSPKNKKPTLATGEDFSQCVPDPVGHVRKDHKDCKIAGCDDDHYARGWCHKHYRRWSRYGNPLARSNNGQITLPRMGK